MSVIARPRRERERERAEPETPGVHSKTGFDMTEVDLAASLEPRNSALNTGAANSDLPPGTA